MYKYKYNKKQRSASNIYLLYFQKCIENNYRVQKKKTCIDYTRCIVLYLRCIFLNSMIMMIIIIFHYTIHITHSSECRSSEMCTFNISTSYKPSEFYETLCMLCYTILFFSINQILMPLYIYTYFI